MRLHRTFRSLVGLARAPAPERTLIVATLLLVPAARLGLRRLSLRRTERLLARLPLPPARRAAEVTPARTVEIVSAVAARLGGTCLVCSLVVRELLARRGSTAALRIGVVRAAGEPLRAHAWVEDADGTVVGRMANPANYLLLPPQLTPPRARGPRA